MSYSHTQMTWTMIYILHAQLSTFVCNYKMEEHIGIQDVIDITKKMSAAERSLFSYAIKVVCIVLVPATHSFREKLFSAMYLVRNT